MVCNIVHGVTHLFLSLHSRSKLTLHNPSHTRPKTHSHARSRSLSHSFTKAYAHLTPPVFLSGPVPACVSISLSVCLCLSVRSCVLHACNLSPLSVCSRRTLLTLALLLFSLFAPTHARARARSLTRSVLPVLFLFFASLFCSSALILPLSPTRSTRSEV